MTRTGVIEPRALLTRKKIFFEAVSQQEGVANAEIGHQFIEIGLLIGGALAQDRGVGLVNETLLIQDFESRRFLGDEF